MATLQARVQSRTEPTFAAFVKLKEIADREVRRQPSVPSEWYVPGYYRDTKGHLEAKATLQNDANAAYRLALCYRIAGELECAAAAVRIINAWATQLKTFNRSDDSMLSFSYHFPALIFAADLLRGAPCWPAQEQLEFEKFLRQSALPMSSMDAPNNWGNWGMLLSISIAAYLKDRELFDRCVERWKQFVEEQIDETGELKHEVTRNQGKSGIWYSNFSLMPQTLSAEIARVNGVDLYEYRSKSGRTIRQAFEKVAGWCLRPETFPHYKGDARDLYGADYMSYFEILNAHWPNKNAAELLNRKRPMTAHHGAPALTLTHGHLLNDDGE